MQGAEVAFGNVKDIAASKGEAGATLVADIEAAGGTALAVHPCGHLGKHRQCANATGGGEAFGHAKQTTDACAG